MFMFKKQREAYNKPSTGSYLRTVETGRFTYYGIDGEYSVSSEGRGAVYVHIKYDYDQLSVGDLICSDVKGFVKRQLSGKYNIYSITLSRY